jgi:hypothetical protein
MEPHIFNRSIGKSANQMVDLVKPLSFDVGVAARFVRLGLLGEPVNTLCIAVEPMVLHLGLDLGHGAGQRGGGHVAHGLKSQIIGHLDGAELIGGIGPLFGPSVGPHIARGDDEVLAAAHEEVDAVRQRLHRDRHRDNIVDARFHGQVDRFDAGAPSQR